MMKGSRLFLLALLSFTIVLMNITSQYAYGYFDDLTNTQSSTIRSGDWTFPSDISISNAFNDAFLAYFNEDTVESLYNNPDFLNLLDASSTTDNPTSAPYALENVFTGLYYFDIEGMYERQSRTALGFLRPLNYETSNNTLLYPLKGMIPDSPEDDPFTSSDVKNALSNDSIAFRLDNEVIITTYDPITNLSSISFYALMGMRENADDRLQPRILTVSIASSKNGPYDTIASFTIQSLPDNENLFDGTLVETNFPFYQFDLTPQQINDMPENGYYVRLSFDGGVEGRGGNVTRSRVIIDNLTLHQEE